MQVACQMVHWIQQALIERSMDGEARVNKNEGGSADHAKGHEEISHDQETVSGEVRKVRESDNKVKESSNEMKESNNEVKESGNEMKESGNEAKESGNKAHERRAMVNGNDIHVKMASGNGKAGKDEANEGE